MYYMSTPTITIDARKLTRAQLREREWLITNGLGGYASGTIGGDIARRYHGLFVPNLANPKGRHLMISRFSEELLCEDRHSILDASPPAIELGEASHLVDDCQVEGRIARCLY